MEFLKGFGMFLLLVVLGLMELAQGQNVIGTAQGELSGEDHDGYVSYRGIPYATVTAVDGKFKASLVFRVLNSRIMIRVRGQIYSHQLMFRIYRETLC